MPEEADNSEIFAAWKVHAYPHYERGVWWYVAIGLIGGALVTIAVMTNNFLLAALLVMVGAVLIIQSGAKPPIVDIEIGPTGLRKGSNFYPYRSIRRFAVVYDPPLKSLYLTVPRTLFSSIQISLEDTDPNHVREVLKKYVQEDTSRESEPIGELLARIFKI